MTRVQVDVSSTNVTLLSGNSVTLEVSTRRADEVLFTVDSGTTGIRSDRYTLKVSVDTGEGFGFQEIEEISVEKTRALSHTNPGYGQKMQFEVINQGKDNSRFRIVAESAELV